MDVFIYIMMGLLIASGLFLVVSVLMQQGKSKGGLSGTIVGGSETFYGKDKTMQRDRLLSRLTTIVAIVFAVLVITLYILVSVFY